MGHVNRKSYIANPMSQEYWEQRYQAGDMPWEKGAPSPGLVDVIEQLAHEVHPDAFAGAQAADCAERTAACAR